MFIRRLVTLAALALVASVGVPSAVQAYDRDDGWGRSRPGYYDSRGYDRHRDWDRDDYRYGYRGYRPYSYRYVYRPYRAYVPYGYYGYYRAVPPPPAYYYRVHRRPHFWIGLGW